MSRNLDDLIEKYSTPDPFYIGPETFSISGKISMSAKIKLEYLAAYFGTKKTPLFGELAEAAINEAFGRVENEMPDQMLRQCSEDLENQEMEEAQNVQR